MKWLSNQSAASRLTRRSFVQAAAVSAAVASFPRLASSGLAAAAAQAPDSVAPEAIHQLMVRVNDWQIAHPYQKSERDCDWIRGTWYTGVMAACRATGDKRFFEQALGWARAKAFAVGYEKSGSNRLFPADTWCELAMSTGDKTLVEKIVSELNTPQPNTPMETRVWYLEGGRRYADSLFGVPVLAKLAKITGEHRFGQNVGDRPAVLKREDSHEYVTGTFLLAASEMYKLAGGLPAEAAGEQPS